VLTSTLVFVGLALLVPALLLQPLLLKASCGLLGVRSPGYLGAAAMLLASWVVSFLASGLWSFTGGMMLGAVSAPLAMVSSLLVSVLVAGVVFSAGLRVAVGKGVAVSLTTHLLGLCCTAVCAMVVKGVLLFV